MRQGRCQEFKLRHYRTATLNDTLEDAFCTRYFGFRPANDKGTANAAA